MKTIQAAREFLAGYFATHERSAKTQTAYRIDILQFQRFLGDDADLSSLGRDQIEGWVSHLRQLGYAPMSIRRKMVVLKLFCTYWVRSGGIQQSPFWYVRLSFGRTEKLPRTLTEVEVRGLLWRAKLNYSRKPASRRSRKRVPSEKASSIDYRSLRNLALVELLLATGIRVGEVSSIDLIDFICEEDAFRIAGKGGRQRLAFVVDKKAIHVQKEYLKARSRVATDSPALFLNASGRRLSTQGIANIVSNLSKEQGIEKHITPHMLRHTVATLLLRNGVDIRLVQEFLGHESIATTQRYTHVSKEHMIRELQSRHPTLTLR